MSKRQDRTIFKRGDKWHNKRNDASRSSSVHCTQKGAQNAARIMLKSQGGGEMITHRLNGKIRAKNTVAPGNDPHPPIG